MRWSESDKYFVNGSLKVYSVVDLSSEPLKMVPVENVIYDGPEGDDFKNLLLDNGFRVNCHGRAIIRIPKRNNDDEYNVFFLQNVVQLSTYGFTKVIPSSPYSPPSTQEVKVLKSLLEETRADLAKKNAEVDELKRQILDWKLTMDAITQSMKKVFVDVDDLKPKPPPAAGGTSGRYPLISAVVGFLNRLRSHLFLDKEEELGTTFLVAANETLASIATILHQRTGLTICIETSRSTTITPADLIQNLNSLKEFVESHFFIDGSVIVKEYGLMNEKDIPVIFRDSERGVDELKQKAKGTISMDNIEGKSIFYGYFNIPSFGKFKGILTKTEVRAGPGPTLPENIMVKLSHRPYKLDVERFWFVEANGEAIFENKSSCLGVDLLGFLRRMINKTFVNKEGRYVSFDFTAIRMLEEAESQIDDENSMLLYCNKWVAIDCFSEVQYDANETPPAFSERRVSLPQGLVFYRNESFTKGSFGDTVLDRAIVCKGFCFPKKTTPVSGPVFRYNAAVTGFFERDKHESECFVDALATTYFVLNPNKFKVLKIPEGEELPRIVRYDQDPLCAQCVHKKSGLSTIHGERMLVKEKREKEGNEWSRFCAHRILCTEDFFPV